MCQGLAKPQVDALLEKLGIDPTVRAEQLDIDTLLALSETLRAASAFTRRKGEPAGEPEG
jgi:16S rRNA A1518/A1519 N6-dimethyltransferase RsmA/KsgA/DIM1 with predicted DNA glycosylase/AP lyase activity